MLNYKEQLEKWLRVESPLVSYSRSLRMEGTSQSTSTDAPEDKKEGGDNKEFDPFAGINVDNLPDDLKEKLSKAREDTKVFTENAKKVEAERVKLDKLARDQQARGDRLFQKLKDHNLVEDGGKKPDKGQIAILQKLTTKFTESGLDPKVASTYAKMFAEAQEILGPDMLQQVGTALNPTFETVGAIQAERAFSDVLKEDEEGIFELDGVEKEVRASVDLLIKAGNPVDKTTIENLRDMAYGKFLRGNPDKKPTKREKEVQQFSTRMTRPGASNAPRIPGQRTNAPVAANGDTAEAMAKTMEYMNRGLTKKGK